MQINLLQKLQDIVDEYEVNVTEKELLNLLQNEKRWPLFYPWGQPTVEIVNNMGELSTDFFKNVYVNGSEYLDYEKWYEYYSLGYTSIISNVFDLTSDLRNLSEALRKVSGCVLNSNFFFSRPGQFPSFAHHSHNYPVIVKQIYGNAKWKVDEKIFNLKSQESLVIPANTMHSVIEKHVKKLSLTINVKF